jgi:hypothetical protein
MSAVVDFYRGDSPDYLGRQLDEILAWNDVRLELVHNYIQVLFPLREESLFNSRAPLLDEETMTAFRGDAQLRANLERAFERMLQFYGMRLDRESGRVERADNFRLAALNWLNPHNHNYRRITRILKCLIDLGLAERARAFFDCLSEVRADYGGEINEDAFAYWKAAAGVEPLPERFSQWR